MKIRVDSDKCIGCGVCEVMCPQCFEVKAGISEVKQENCECTKDIASSCPVGAIIVEK